MSSKLDITREVNGMPRLRNEQEIRDIAAEVLDSLRPRHLTVCQIREVARAIIDLTDYIVLREKPEHEE